jgi:hypothetical protein
MYLNTSWAPGCTAAQPCSWSTTTHTPLDTRAHRAIHCHWNACSRTRSRHRRCCLTGIQTRLHSLRRTRLASHHSPSGMPSLTCTAQYPLVAVPSRMDPRPTRRLSVRHAADSAQNAYIQGSTSSAQPALVLGSASSARPPPPSDTQLAGCVDQGSSLEYEVQLFPDPFTALEVWACPCIVTHASPSCPHVDRSLGAGSTVHRQGQVLAGVGRAP